MIASALNVRFIRFLCAGGVNAITTYAVFLACIQLVNYKVSYTAAYLVGIVISFAMNRNFVFRSPQRLKFWFQYLFIYFAQYGFGLALLVILVNRMGVAEEFGPLLVILITIPASYWLNKIFFIRGQNE